MTELMTEKVEWTITTWKNGIHVSEKPYPDHPESLKDKENYCIECQKRQRCMDKDNPHVVEWFKFVDETNEKPK